MFWDKYKRVIYQKLEKNSSVIDLIEVDRIKKELINILEMIDYRKISGLKYYWRDSLRNYSNSKSNIKLPIILSK